MMYGKKIQPILEDIENKEVELAGGSVVGMVLAQVSSLIKYICNLTENKPKYVAVQDEVLAIKKLAEELKERALKAIDKDREVLEEILKSYKTRKENPEEYEETCKNAVELCMEVTNLALEVLELTNRISKVGNKMLSSDFKICAFYSFSSVEASIVNVKINVNSVDDEKYKEVTIKRYEHIYEEAKRIKEEILKGYTI